MSHQRKYYIQSEEIHEDPNIQNWSINKIFHIICGKSFVEGVLVINDKVLEVLTIVCIHNPNSLCL